MFGRLRIAANGYVCFYKGKRIEVQADTSFEARKKAEVEFQRGSRAQVKGYDISVTLAEKGGETVTHNPAEF